MTPLFLFTLWAAVVSAAQVSGVFTGFPSLVWQAGGNYYKPLPEFSSWVATLDWAIQGSKFKAGDTFTLHMPCVFQFTANTPTVQLKVNNDVYATCNFYSGEIITTYSELQCTMSDLVNDQTDVSGTLTVPMFFNTGLTANAVDLTNAKCFKAGDNTVTFTDGNNEISTNVNFNGGQMLGPLDPNNIIVGSRFVPSLNTLQHFLAAGKCDNGYTSGTLGITVDNTNLDCSTLQAQITLQLNDWFFPESSQNFNFQTTCTGNTFTATYNNVPAGFRPFIDIMGSAPSGNNGFIVHYTNDYFCNGDPTVHSNGQGVNWGQPQNTDSGSDGNAAVVTTRTWTGSTTRVTTLPYNTAPGNTKTIEVDVPIPTTTVTSTWTGTNTVTTTKTATPGGTASVIVEVPTPATTITNTWTGSGTTTTTVPPASSGGTETVIVDVPTPKTTVTRTWTGSETTTSTIPAPSGGTETVVVDVPPPKTTVTRTWTESYSTTSTIPASSGGTETVVVDVPPPKTTVTRTWTESFSTTSTIPAPSGGTETVVVDVPPPATTITTPWTGSFTTTSTIPASSGGTETVIVQVPTPGLTTVTSTWTGSVTRTTTHSAPSGGTTTVEIDVPPQATPATTITTPWTGSFTTTSTVPASSGGTETVIVQVPTPGLTTVTSTWTGSVTRTTTHSAPSGGTTTVEIDVPSISSGFSTILISVVPSISSSEPLSSSFVAPFSNSSVPTGLSSSLISSSSVVTLTSEGPSLATDAPPTSVPTGPNVPEGPNPSGPSGPSNPEASNPSGPSGPNGPSNPEASNPSESTTTVIVPPALPTDDTNVPPATTGTPNTSPETPDEPITPGSNGGNGGNGGSGNHPGVSSTVSFSAAPSASLSAYEGSASSFSFSLGALAVILISYIL